MSGAPVEGLALSITRFVRLLRGAGFRLGPGAVIDALDAVQTVGLKRRDDVYAALHATCVSRREQDRGARFPAESAVNQWVSAPQELGSARASICPRWERLRR